MQLLIRHQWTTSILFPKTTVGTFSLQTIVTIVVRFNVINTNLAKMTLVKAVILTLNFVDFQVNRESV